jgi:CRP-like cAMP-binding protein
VCEAIRNPFLPRFTPAELDYLDLERIPLRKGDVLARMDEPMSHYIFIERGLACAVKTMSDDRSCKVGHISNWGIVGISSFFLTDRSTADYVVALPGEGLRAERERLRCVVSRNPDLTMLFKELAHTAWVIHGLNSACNRLHEFEQRLCRWLIIASTAIEADHLPVNQTEVARLLGVNRNLIGAVVKKLSAEGILRWERNGIRLVDKPAVEAKACECLMGMTRRFEKIIANAQRKNEFFLKGATYVARAAPPPDLRLR